MGMFIENLLNQGSTPLLEQVLTRGDLPGAIEAMAVRVRLEVAKLEGSENQQLETRYLEALIRSLADGR